MGVTSKFIHFYCECLNRVVNITGLKFEENNTERIMAILRTEQILRLDFLLHQHRENHGTAWEPLRGKKALHHLLLMKLQYQKPIDLIENFSLSQALFVLQCNLKSIELPEDVEEWIQEAKDECNQRLNRIELPLCKDEEWDCFLYENYLI